MKSNKTVAAVLALAAMTSGLPVAAQSLSGERPHFYAGASAGSNDDEEVAFRILGGYQINPNVAAEIGYHRLGSMNVNGSSFHPRAVELVGIGSVPIGPVSLYGKLGFYRGTKTSGNDNTDLTYGVGVLYDLARNLSVRGEWQRYDGLKTLGGDHDADVMNVGVLFRFN